MVVNSFDLWQKDVFFSAAEEVQKSTDMYGFLLDFDLVISSLSLAFDLA